VAAVRVRFRREAIKTALALLSESQLALTKCVILVDAGVDPRDFDAVLAAMRRNFDPERDLTIIPRAPLDTLDFSSFRMHLGSKMIVDATSPVEEELAAQPSAKGTVDPVSIPRLEGVDGRVRDWRLVGDVLLAVRIDSHPREFATGAQLSEAAVVGSLTGDDSIPPDVFPAGQAVSPGREVCEKLLRTPLPSRVRLVAVLSEDVDLNDPVSLLWGIFTRFDPARDVTFAHTEIRGVWPVYRGPMGIDATFKPGYPDPLEMPEEMIQKVSRRWGEYFG
jgi:4-hydroxy-3-polyprenylbenzoate decarboxylase